MIRAVRHSGFACSGLGLWAGAGLLAAAFGSPRACVADGGFYSRSTSPEAPAVPSKTLPSVLKDVDIDQSKLGSKIDLSLKFRDEEDREVTLGQYFKPGKPVILNLVYYGCPRLCTMVITGLVRGLQVMPSDNLKIGEHYEVVTVSFDPTETATLARAKKAGYMASLGMPAAEKSWHFLTGNQASISALTEAVGFRYKWDEAIKQYAHASGIMLVTPEGMLSKYFYGTVYTPKDLRLGLTEASAGKAGGLAEKILLFCYHYDPSRGTYRARMALLAVRIAAYATLAGLGAFIFTMLRRERRQRLSAS